MEKQHIFLCQENFRGCDILKNAKIHGIKAVNKFPVSEKRGKLKIKKLR